ncbi:cystathionine beta-lyase [Limibacillus halophilus]|uniref:Cystathionine beta-lyase n=1 Tax=Limibacillus halophilus TaxID=1579333 RepID=A0A839SWZ9_9PROT|nr:cystathionine beta-lyase [Limibacillus halophilus]MBB3065505.1 cystathionine beta-lyase [Limibacillus halophilus]
MTTSRVESKRTRLVQSARHSSDWNGALNAPLMRASTILFDRLDEYEVRPDRSSRKPSYGIAGTTTHFAFQEALAELEGAADAITLSSGLAANTVALQAFVNQGDHILVTDSIYYPARRFCDKILKRQGVETTYYDPTIGAGIEALIRPNTKLIYMETPGSLTFEMQDVPAIVAAARKHGVRTALDNTWATPLFYRPLEQGVDVSIQAGTKYIGGHGDLMLGYIAANEASFRAVYDMALFHGHCCGPEEAYQGLRGLRSMGARLDQHQRGALAVARWLQERPEVDRVLYPALPEDPGHALWKRDFDGATGLLGIVLAKPYEHRAVEAMIESYKYFGIGASWGSFASLVVSGYPERHQTARRWEATGPLLRYHIGLEDPDDLINDLTAGFERLEQANKG